jgi:AcrR family transcriptional regulator
MDKNDKYNRILKAAIEVISEKGLQKTTISDIVKKADTAQGTFYLYFSSKTALIPAIAENLLQMTLDKVQSTVNEKDNFWHALEIYIDQIYAITDQYKDVVVLCYSGTAFDYSLETWEKIYQPLYAWFENLLADSIRKQEVIDSVPIQWTSKLIINSIENSAERFYIGKDQEMTCEDSKKELLQFIRRSLAIK